MRCVSPSSVTAKSAEVRPVTGCPFLSVTTTSTSTSWVVMESVGGCWLVAGPAGAGCWAGACVVKQSKPDRTVGKTTDLELNRDIGEPPADTPMVSPIGLQLLQCGYSSVPGIAGF